MAATVLPIGIPPQERARLCALAAADVCQRSVAHVGAAARCAAQDAAAAPYIRALYVHCAGSVAAERVVVASGSKCGAYLQETLRATVAGIRAPAVACWLTVTLEDTCILQHAVFAISSESKESLNMAPSVLEKSDGAACPTGARRWSLLPAHAPRYATKGDSVYASHDETLDAVVPHLPPAAEAGSLPQQQQRTPLPTQYAYERIQKKQTDAARHAASSVCRCSHGAPPPEKNAARPHLSQLSAEVVHRLDGPGSSASTASHLFSAARLHPQSAVNHSTGVYSSSNTNDAAAPAPPDSGQRTYRAQPKPASHPPRSESAESPVLQPRAASSIATSQSFDYLRAPPPNANQLMYACPCTDLVVSSDGRQWSDWAFRTCYSPRRQELWEIADTVMTHNYHCHMIEGGGEPPYDESRRLRCNGY
ncbi:hypothetical protein LSCM4_04038 [Leishmania orientalis]|uniref:Uncharacterized protein n=1 Tax=Leishmania orientalis TaxID=2249476 RepID=A0A836KG32_9TRYP|nr:hypothetical protein LSCM4_04038 [Leishmania orientalis]